MRKVLMITTHFAPDRHVGAKRMTKFAKYLPDYGWQPIVLTKEVGEYHGLDDSLLRELPHDLAIHRIPNWRVRRKRPGSPSSSNGASLTSVAKRPDSWRSRLFRTADLLFFFDYQWLLPSVVAARRLIRENGIDTIYSSIPNWEAHLVALFLKMTTRVQWACEYRDPWTRVPAAFFPPLSPLQPAAEWAIEGQVLKRADRLIFVGPGNRDRILNGRPSSYVSKANIIYNGYDEDDFFGLGQDKSTGSAQFTIGHVGSFGNWRTPEPFLRALGEVLRKRPELRSSICVRVIGEIKFDPNMAQQIPWVIQQEDLADVISLEPFLPHRQGLAQMVRCDCLLLVQYYLPDAPAEGMQAIGAKTFEYLRSQRPILALVPIEGDAARLVREFNAGVVVSPHDIEGIARAILELYDAFCRKKLTVHNDLASLQQFDRKQQARELARILDEVASD